MNESTDAPLVAEMQCSIVDEYCHGLWVSGVAGNKVTVAKLWHYRMVLKTVGYGLARVRGTQELLHTTFDVFHGADLRTLHAEVSYPTLQLYRMRTSAPHVYTGI